MDKPVARVRIVDGVASVEVDISPAPDPDALVTTVPSDEGVAEANPAPAQLERWIPLSGL